MASNRTAAKNITDILSLCQMHDCV